MYLTLTVPTILYEKQKQGARAFFKPQGIQEIWYANQKNTFLDVVLCIENTAVSNKNTRCITVKNNIKRAYLKRQVRRQVWRFIQWTVREQKAKKKNMFVKSLFHVSFISRKLNWGHFYQKEEWKIGIFFNFFSGNIQRVYDYMPRLCVLHVLKTTRLHANQHECWPIK